MKANRKKILNHSKEIRINNCIFTKTDIQLMFIDAGMSITKFAKHLGVGRRKANKILDFFSIPKSWHAELTPRRLRVLRFIAYYQQKYKTSPKMVEVARAIGIPLSSVSIHIKNLTTLGYIERNKRELKLTKKAERWCDNANTFNLFGVEEYRENPSKHEG